MEELEIPQRKIPREKFDREFYDQNYPYFNKEEKAYYEGFVQPVVQAYKDMQQAKANNLRKHGALPASMKNPAWRINVEKMGPYKDLLLDKKGRKSYVAKGQAEATMIIASEIMRLKLNGRRIGDIATMLGMCEKTVFIFFTKMVNISAKSMGLNKENFTNQAIMSLSKLQDHITKIIYDPDTPLSYLKSSCDALFGTMDRLKEFIIPMETTETMKVKLSPDEIELTKQRLLKMVNEET